MTLSLSKWHFNYSLLGGMEFKHFSTLACQFRCELSNDCVKIIDTTLYENVLPRSSADIYRRGIDSGVSISII